MAYHSESENGQNKHFSDGFICSSSKTSLFEVNKIQDLRRDQGCSFREMLIKVVVPLELNAIMINLEHVGSNMNGCRFKPS